MKICIILGPFLPAPPGKCGAVELCWNGIARHFVALGHDVTILCKAWDEASSRQVNASGVMYLTDRGEVRTGRLIIDILKDLRFSWRVLRRLPESDVVVCNTFWTPLLLALSGRRGEMVVAYNLQRYPKGSWHLWLYKNADRVLAVSRAIRDAVACQMPGLLARTVVIPNPIDTDVFCYTGATGTSGGKQRVVLYTGRINQEKGLHVLVSACRQVAARCPDVVLRLVGESDVALGGGGPAYLESLRSLAGDLSIDFQQAIYDRHSLADALRACDVYCYPSLAEKGESFGVAPLEAMAVGCPVVVSSLECFRDFLDDGRTGLVFDHRCDNSADILADVLWRILADRDAASAMGNRAAESARRFSYENVAEQYVSVFEEDLQDRRSRQA